MILRASARCPFFCSAFDIKGWEGCLQILQQPGAPSLPISQIRSERGSPILSAAKGGRNDPERVRPVPILSLRLRPKEIGRMPSDPSTVADADRGSPVAEVRQSLTVTFDCLIPVP